MMHDLASANVTYYHKPARRFLTPNAFSHLRIKRHFLAKGICPNNLILVRLDLSIGGHELSPFGI